MKITTSEARRTQHSERGAALVTVLMMSTLLLATGGALVLVTSLSTRTTIDATAEMQAYYAAEVGLQDTLNVLRGNVNPMAGMPGNSTIDFRKAVTPSQSNRNGDNSGRRHLSGWLNYNYSVGGILERVALTPSYSPLNGLAYRMDVSDPDSIVGTEPARLLLRSYGYGPKGAEKRLELIVKRTSFDYAPPAMLMIRGADDCSPVTFTIGDSNSKDYSGHDLAPTGAVLPTFGATCSGDETIELNADTKNTVEAPEVSNVPPSNLPEYLRTADNARAFIVEQRLNAQNEGRYFTSFSGTSGTTARPLFTFVDGDCTLDGGAGLLIITGRLIMNGNPSFSGLILVMGQGTVERSGAGNGEFAGAMAVARFSQTGGPFLAPRFLTDGAGTSSMQYDSNALHQALNTAGPRVLGIREF